MRFIKDLKEGDRIGEVYLIKQKVSAVTKNGKAYYNVTLMDKSGELSGKVWDPDDPAIDEFEAKEYVELNGEIVTFNGALQINIRRARKAQEGQYDPKDYLPVTPYDPEKMYAELLEFVDSVKNPYLNRLLNFYFREDPEFIKKFRYSSAAKSMHHGFIGGLLQHTLAVTRLCDYLASRYEKLNRDLLITAAICHDIGKVRELSPYPDNDYTNEGNFLGHIVVGVEMIDDAIYGRKGREGIEGFPKILEQELKHCIVSHHGEFEFGSPKKPAIIEAIALNFADNTDAKLQIFTELLENEGTKSGWLGFKKTLDSNVIVTRTD
ncbi:MAG: HD domain-containing protein [Lachnospiraceae bacterium]|nr:HD domain-containing protein [Lachnospiraceae bacterium]